MKVLKGCSIALLSFILFFLLTTFGLAFTVNQVALSPSVVNGIIRDIDFAEVARAAFAESDSPKDQQTLDMEKAVVDTLESVQPVVKEKLYIAVHDTYDYLLGGSKTPNLKVVLGNSFMNKDFVEKLMAEIDLTNLVEQTLKEDKSEGSGNSQALQTALLDTIKNIEPDFKKQVVTASDPIFKYLLGQSSSIDLKTTARNTFLSNNFVSTVIDNIDIQQMMRDMIREQFGPLPEGVKLTDAELDKMVAILEPSVKSNLKSAVGPVADYMVGKTEDFSITLSFQAVIDEFKPVVTEAFMASAPPEIQGASQEQINAAVEKYWRDAVSTIPTTVKMDSSNFGAGMNTGTNEMFTELQNGLDKARENIDSGTRDFETQLTDVRTGIKYFRLAFLGLIGLILVIIGGIVLIYRSVKDSCRSLGITFTIYGAITFAIVMVVRYIAPVLARNNVEDMPQFVSDMLPKLIGHLTSPLFIVGLVCLLGGIAMIVISVIYPRMQAKKTETAAPPAQPPTSS
ncbi:MAG: hypothetical protein PHE50_05705 [Dehalococcoidales bacterium]|nr:hypothetical protein [Dehalococcoidales bacterium]